MKAKATESGQQSGQSASDVPETSSGRYPYTKVLDGRKHPIKGLYQRGYYDWP